MSVFTWAQVDTASKKTSEIPVVTTPLWKQVPVVGVPRRIFTGIDSLKQDSVSVITDSTDVVADSLAADTLVSSIPSKDSLVFNVKHPVGSDSARFLASNYLKFTNPVRYTATRRQWDGKENVFYSVIALLIVFALLRNTFHRYVGDLFRMFFQTTVRQRQIRDQMLQSPLPSLLFNIFFALSAGVFIALLMYHFGWAEQINLLLLTLYAAAGLAAIYLGKFFVLRTMGWLVGARDATGAYIFIVFTANKIIGIVLLPFIVILAFTSGFVYQASVTLSIVVVVALLLYRYFISYMAVSRSLRIHFLHFLLYVLAFEVLPLLLINKLLFILLDQLY